MKTTTLLGAHLSIAGGPENALYNGKTLGCTTIQIFTQSNRQWSTKLFAPETIETFELAKKETGITSIISHASYLINLGSNTAETRKKSLEALKNELQRCNQLGIHYVVLHPGSGTPKDDAIKRIQEGINEALLGHTGVSILLEIMAGQGSTVGASLEELATMREGVENKRHLGICLDTCHAWAAGYDFSTPESYHNFWHSFDKIIGINHLKAFHLNDSLKPQGSHVDRHTDIGKGTLGLEPFRLLMNDDRFKDIPKIIETPKSADHALQDDMKNLEILRSLIR